MRGRGGRGLTGPQVPRHSGASGTSRLGCGGRGGEGGRDSPDHKYCVIVGPQVRQGWGVGGGGAGTHRITSTAS